MHLSPGVFFKGFQHRRIQVFNDYEDYKKLRIYFGLMTPFKFWQGSRSVRKFNMGGTFLTRFSYLELRFDYILKQLGLFQNIFIARRFLDFGYFTINGKIVKARSIRIKPYMRISVFCSELRRYFQLNYLARLHSNRVEKNVIKQIPRYIEFNFKIFMFMFFPNFCTEDIQKPFMVNYLGVGGGKHEII